MLQAIQGSAKICRSARPVSGARIAENKHASVQARTRVCKRACGSRTPAGQQTSMSRPQARTQAYMSEREICTHRVGSASPRAPSGCILAEMQASKSSLDVCTHAWISARRRFTRSRCVHINQEAETGLHAGGHASTSFTPACPLMCEPARGRCAHA